MSDSATGARNTIYRWKVDPDGLVHAKICKEAREDAVMYGAAPKDALEMAAHLGRLDFKDGHYAVSILRPCSTCIAEDLA